MNMIADTILNITTVAHNIMENINKKFSSIEDKCISFISELTLTQLSFYQALGCMMIITRYSKVLPGVIGAGHYRTTIYLIIDDSQQKSK